MAPTVEEKIRALGLQDQVELTGRLEDPVPALHRFDIFVLPSHNEDGTRRRRAMAAGLPVVASSVGACPTWSGWKDRTSLVPRRPRDGQRPPPTARRWDLRWRWSQEPVWARRGLRDQVMFERLESLRRNPDASLRVEAPSRNTGTARQPPGVVWLTRSGLVGKPTPVPVTGCRCSGMPVAVAVAIARECPFPFPFPAR